MKTSGNAQHTAIDMRAKFTPTKVINTGIRHRPEFLLWIKYLNCVR